ncbi:MAG: hypothetical protein ABI468_06250 [Candidatus Nanopelagicales bacterium]
MSMNQSRDSLSAGAPVEGDMRRHPVLRRRMLSIVVSVLALFAIASTPAYASVGPDRPIDGVPAVPLTTAATAATASLTEQIAWMLVGAAAVLLVVGVVAATAVLFRRHNHHHGVRAV